MRGIGPIMALTCVLGLTTVAVAQEDGGAGKAAAGSDHSQMVGRLAVGYLGKRILPVRSIVGGGDQSAPVIGVRYWLSESLGLDLGVGFVLSSGKTEVGSMDTDAPDSTGVIVHGGVPLALASTGHFSFQIVPELNVGFGSGTDPDPIADTDHNGLILEAGARAGAEVHFGFIDIPQLSLQGGIGLLLRRTSHKSDTGGTEVTETATDVASTTNQDPWQIFTGGVSALYYF